MLVLQRLGMLCSPNIRQRILSCLLRIQRIRTYMLGNARTDLYLCGQQIGNEILPDKNNSSGTLERLRLFIPIHFCHSTYPRETNAAADYPSHMEVDPKEKLILKIREDIETRRYRDYITLR